jgi:hypothetical protein
LVQTIHTKQAEPGEYPDPIDAISAAVPAKDYGNPVAWNAFAAVVILAALLCIWLMTRDVTRLAESAGILALLWAAVGAIANWLQGKKFPWRKFLAHANLVIVLVTVFYCFYCIGLSHFDLPAGPAVHLWNRLASSAVLMAGFLFLYYARSSFRGRELWYLEFRLDLLAMLVAHIAQRISKLRAGASAGAFDEQRAEEVLVTVMSRLASILSMNVWERSVNFLAFWSRPVGALSLWYLEPSGEKEFQIVRFVAPGAPKDVFDLFEEIKKSYRPARHDQAAYDHLKGMHFVKKDDKKEEFNEEGFRRSPDLHKVTSMTGWVFATRRPIFIKDLATFLHYDDSVFQKYQGQLGSEAKRWLTFRTAIACPILNPISPGSEPLGVLLGYKNQKNLLIPEDISCMLTAGRLIGRILSEVNHGAKQVSGSV